MKTASRSCRCIDAVAEEYLAELRAVRYSERSVQTYRGAIRDMIAAIGKPDPRAITGRDLDAYRGGLLARGLKPSSVAVYLQAAKLFFRYLAERQRIFENPAERLPPLRSRKRLQPVPTEAEMAILLAQPDVTTPLGVRNRAILETMYSTALRREETTGLAVTSVHLSAGEIRVMGKGSRERMAPLGPAAAEWLGRYLAEVRPTMAGAASGEALWLTCDGKPLSGSGLQAVLLQYRGAPGIVTHIGLHSIRRACATHMLRRGASPLTIQMLLGHANMGHLAQYLRLSVTDVKRMHEQSRVGE